MGVEGEEVIGGGKPRWSSHITRNHWHDDLGRDWSKFGSPRFESVASLHPSIGILTSFFLASKTTTTNWTDSFGNDSWDLGIVFGGLLLGWE